MGVMLYSIPEVTLTNFMHDSGDVGIKYLA